jgi:sugar phosphate isomerase/epimerase
MPATLAVLTTEFPRPDLDATLDAIAAQGIRDVQFQMGSALPDVPRLTSLTVGLIELGGRIDAPLCATVRDKLAARGIRMAAVDGTYNMIHPDPAKRAAGAAALRRLVSLCRDLETGIVTLSTGTLDPDSMWRANPANQGAGAWDATVRAVAAAAAFAEEHGVTLAFEPEVGNVVDSVVRARRLVDEVGSPALKVLMDPANVFKAGELPLMRSRLDEWFELVGGDVVLAHAKDLDHDGEAGKRPAGRGVLDYQYYLAGLGSIGYAGSVVLHGMTSIPEDEYASCFDHVRRSAPAGLF